MQKAWAALGLMSSLLVCGQANAAVVDVSVTPFGLELGSASIFNPAKGTVTTETFNSSATPLGKTGSYSTPFATFSGGGVIVHGSSKTYAAPWLGPFGFADPARYLEIGANQSETIAFTGEKTALGLYWGSVDSFNTIAFYNNGSLVYSLTGAQLESAITSGPKLTDGGGQTGFKSNGFVTFSGVGLGDFNEVVLSSTKNAFEVADIEAFAPKLTGSPVPTSPAVPETSTWLMMILGFASVGFVSYRRKGRALKLRIA